MHVDACLVVSKYVVPGDLVFLATPHNLRVHAVSQVFHRFAEHRIVHQLVEVGLEVAFRLL